MTDMRDARFKKALDAAPDADARPARSVAEFIRAAARSTPAQPLASTAATAWWQRWWRRSGSPRAPWNAAFATLLLGVLVTVMWVQQPIPDARPIAPAPAPAPAAGGTAPPAAPAPTATAVTPAEAVADAARTPQAAPRAKQQAAESAPTPASKPQQAAPTADAPKPVQPNLGDMQKRAAEQMANKAVLAESARAAAPALQEPPAAAAMAAAPAPFAVAPAPAPVAPLRLDTQGLQIWSALALRLDAQLVTVDQVQGQALFAQMQSEVRRLVLAAMPATALPAEAPRLRITVLQQDQTLAHFTLWANAIRWQRTGQPAVLGAIDAADAQVLVTLAQQAVAAASPAPN